MKRVASKIPTETQVSAGGIVFRPIDGGGTEVVLISVGNPRAVLEEAAGYILR